MRILEETDEPLLRRIANLFEQLTVDMPTTGERGSVRKIEHHGIFLLLYYYTTKNWLSYAARSKEPAFLYTIMERFLDIYERDILKPVNRNCYDCPTHWRDYFVAAKAYQQRADPIRRARMVYHGARAHTRFDLMEAIIRAQSDERFHTNDPHVQEQRKSAMLGPCTDRLFAAAARQFLCELDRYLVGIEELTGRTLVQKAVGGADGLWLRWFQRWRHSAWRDAMALTSAQRQLEPCGTQATSKLLLAENR